MPIRIKARKTSKNAFKNLLWNENASWRDKIFYCGILAFLILGIVGILSAWIPSQPWLRATYLLTPAWMAWLAVYQAQNIIKGSLGIKRWKAWAIFPLWIGIFGLISWVALAFGLPSAMSSFLVSRPQLETRTVVRKSQGLVLDGRVKLACDTGHWIAVAAPLLPRPLCMLATDWASVRIGDAVVVGGMGNWFGMRMEGIYVRKPQTL